MKFSTNLLFCIFGAVCVACAPANEEVLPIASRLTNQELADLRRRVKGCNANVCFAIDGSGSISESQFRSELSAALDTISLLAPDRDLEIAAVQYGDRNSVISRLTPDIDAVKEGINNATQTGGSSAMRRAISFCTRELTRRSGEPMKMILIGDGRSDRPAAALRRANRFRALGGEVCVVGAGLADPVRLLALAGGDPSKVFEVDNLLDLIEVKFLVEAMVDEICGVEEVEV